MQTTTRLAIALSLALIAACGVSSDTPSRVEQSALLDRVPDTYFDTIARFRAAEAERQAEALAPPGPEIIYVRGVQWDQPVVTVAFNGSDEATYELIEAAANEWVRNANGHFSFSFRDANRNFRLWTAQDVESQAEIRISFETEGPNSGYWSDIGRVATSAHPAWMTMNLDDIGSAGRRFAGQPQAWLDSHEHHTVLHEFGHALGLEHEHYHPQCQRDLKFAPDRGYVHTPSENRYFLIEDRQRRSPGAILYYQGPRGWDERKSRLAVDAQFFFSSFTGGDDRFESPTIDQDSVMLYVFPGYLTRSGANSPCRVRQNPVRVLSRGDIEYFQSIYNRPLPRQ
jgi:hypothetical protein